jgi:hypothetical protein
MGHYTRVTQAVGRMRRKPARKLAALARKLSALAEKETPEPPALP